MTLSPQFGAKVRKSDLEKFSQSKNWSGKKFENLVKTSMDISIWDIPSMLKENFKDSKKKSPQKNIPILPLNTAEFESDEPKFVWYGHSVGLLRIAGKNLLIDPMLGPDASPPAPMSTKRFSTGSLDVIDNLPPIDAVLITHDHYDHLDLASIRKLKDKVPQWFVALGVSRHLEKWGVPADTIQEFDWWDDVTFDSVHITFTPSRHFSGRGALDRAKSLWGGWVFKTESLNVYWTGDGGYGDHFKEVGEKLGPFDWAFAECGQYNEHWHQIHMYPEESVQASLDSRSSRVVPVHWGGFSLAPHSWTDPIERFVKEAINKDLAYSTPRIGEVVSMNGKGTSEDWYKEY